MTHTLPARALALHRVILNRHLSPALLLILALPPALDLLPILVLLPALSLGPHPALALTLIQAAAPLALAGTPLPTLALHLTLGRRPRAPLKRNPAD